STDFDIVEWRPIKVYPEVHDACSVEARNREVRVRFHLRKKGGRHADGHVSLACFKHRKTGFRRRHYAVDDAVKEGAFALESLEAGQHDLVSSRPRLHLI